MSDSMEPAMEQPAAPPTLGEQVRKIIAEAGKPLAFAKVKSGLKLAGVKLSGQGKVTDEEIQKELDEEGVFLHPAKNEKAKPTHWHTRHVTAAEKAAAKAEATAKAKAEKAEAAALKVAEKTKLKQEALATAAKAKADKAAADAKAKAEKAAEALRVQVAAVEDALFKLVEALGDKPVALKKPAAKSGAAVAEAFETTMNQLLNEKKLFAHPGGKHGKHAPLPPLAWHEKAPHKAAFAAILKAAQKVLDNKDVSLDEVIARLREQLTHAAKLDPEPTPFDLADFAKRILVVAAATGTHARPYQNKVFISAAWHDSQHASDFPKLTLEEFKRHLLEANGKRLLNLSQANEVQMMNPQLVKDSETIHAGSQFHFIRLQGDNP